MVMGKLKGIFSRQQDINWLEVADNPWGVRVLDVRPITHTMMSVTTEEQHAINAISFGQDDGRSFIGEEPPINLLIEANLSFPIDRSLADGVLFTPHEMEHKWALFYHLGEIICVQSWRRQVQVVARVEEHQDRVEIRSVQGVFVADDDLASRAVAGVACLDRVSTVRTHWRRVASRMLSTLLA